MFVFAKPPQAKRSAWIEFIHEQDKKEKSWHPWQQSLGSVEHWLRAFSRPGDLVVDRAGAGSPPLRHAFGTTAGAFRAP